ncbi:MAG: PaaI family thioesterase [Nitratireductor rhodophyticola]|uniref:PaaI family thioesterase n=1 Tax=Nitratireductor rhodophyticola TaxID=2854036 RepID=UPI0032D9999B
MDDLYQLSRHVFEAQPFSIFLGAELTRASSDGVTLSLTVADHHKQQHGYVHGGVISYLADNSLTFAGGLALGGDALTSEFKLNYLKPAKGSRLEARAEAQSVGRRQAVCRCEIYSIEGAQKILCALGQGTIVAVGK